METKITFHSSKEIKKFILDSTNNLEEIIEYLDIDYKTTIEGIFNALFSLLRNYDQNQSRVQYLINLLDQLAVIKSVEETKMMIGPIIDFNNKISLWKTKERIKINIPFSQIQELLNSINRKEMADIHNEKVKYLSFLIFQDKNLKMIESFLGISTNLLGSKNEDGDTIFSSILRKYIYLDEKDENEINYYYQVILLFVNSKYGKSIMKDVKNYMRIIKQSKLEYKAHVIKLMELLTPDFTITLEELENRYHKHFTFPNVILKEIESFKIDHRNRIDFTNQECITIDGADAKCLDDAIYIEKNEDGTYTLYIHIIDIPSIIPYHSLTNEEAYKRMETLYLKDRNISLYPEDISDNLASLLPNQKRAVITYIFKLDPNFELIENNFKVVKGLIKVKHRLTYEDVDQRLSNLTYDNLAQTLLYLYLFSERRRESNKEKEKYRELQNSLEFDPSRESLKISYSASANIVHESMILVNYKIAEFFKDISLPYLFRKLELPSEDFIEEQLLKLIKLDSKYAEDKSFIYRLKEGYAKPEYTVEPDRHKGLNLPVYSHSSSPARRYGDGHNQYLVHDLIFNRNITDLNIYAWEYRTKNLATHLNLTKKTNEVFSSHYNYLAYKKLIKTKK